MKGEITEAIGHYKNALNLKYEKPDCLYNLGNFLFTRFSIDYSVLFSGNAYCI